MAKPHMLAGGIVEPGAGSSGAVLAFVAVRAGLAGSRLFKLHGTLDAPAVEELPPKTTVNLARFQAEVEEALKPVVEEILARGGKTAITRPSAEWVGRQVLQFLGL